MTSGEDDIQYKLVHLISMFEVSFTARQRKNYLFYCLLYLFNAEDWNDLKGYCDFVSDLAKKYFYVVYLVAGNLNEINTPKPGSFDVSILNNKNKLDITLKKEEYNFTAIYGDGTMVSSGIPLYIFNYLDYLLWEKYAYELRGKETKRNDKARKNFFNTLGAVILT